ncbi:hypothetical protein QL285_016198 [Trifolium repens]|nr:hypothetical protein QL285_016198 [Trifolium repens]
MFDDHKECHSRNILGKLSEKINTVTYFIKEIEKRFFKKEKRDIPTLLGSLNSIKYKDKLHIQYLKRNNNINNLNQVTIVVSFVELKGKEASVKHGMLR